MEFSFNTDGEIFIDSRSIPNANIFEIFPALFIKSPKIINGLKEVTTKLSSLNLNHLFRKGMLKALKRPRNYKYALCVHNQEFMKDKYKHWWYLGKN